MSPTCVMLQLHLPAHTRHELLEGLAAAGVGEDADLVLLALGHIYHSHLVRLPPLLMVQILQLTHCSRYRTVRHYSITDTEL